MTVFTDLVVIAAEEVPGGTVGAYLAVPLGFLIFVGSIYLLLRSNYGTRRGYLILGTAWFGFLTLMALFWTFGAPGTPQATGPRNLPGQHPMQYTPHWVPFAGDSRVAEEPEYRDLVAAHPGDPWGEVPPEFVGDAETGTEEIHGFFADPRPDTLGELWEPVEVRYAEAPNNFPVIAVTFQETYQPADLPEDAPPDADPPLTPGGVAGADYEANVAPEGTQAGDPVPDGATETLFGFFDPGAPLFPSMVVFGVSLVLFLLHVFLLDRDELRERRELAGVPAEERERVSAGV
jgi:hypothetical protein